MNEKLKNRKNKNTNNQKYELKFEKSKTSIFETDKINSVLKNKQELLNNKKVKKDFLQEQILKIKQSKEQKMISTKNLINKKKSNIKNLKSVLLKKRELICLLTLIKVIR